MLLFGGVTYSAVPNDAPLDSAHPAIETRTLTDTWSWNGSDWTQVGTSSPEASHRPDPQMAWSAQEHRMLLDSVCNGACYQSRSRLCYWSEATKTWIALRSDGSMPWNEEGQYHDQPPALDTDRPVWDPTANGGDGRAIVSDPATGGVLYVGDGQNSIFDSAENKWVIDHTTTETWRWVDGSWHPLHALPNIRPKIPQPIAVNAGGAVLLITSAGDAATWTGSGWNQSYGLPARADAAIAYDGDTREVVVFGGVASRPSNVNPGDPVGGIDADTWVGTPRSDGGLVLALGPEAPQSIPSAWVQPDAPAALAVNSREHVLEIAEEKFNEHHGFSSFEVKLAHRHDILGKGYDFNEWTPLSSPRNFPGRLVWVVVGHCINPAEPNGGCLIVPRYAGANPSMRPSTTLGYREWTFDALSPIDEQISPCVPACNGGGGAGTEPSQWDTIPDLSAGIPAASSPTQKSASAYAVGAVVVIVLFFLLGLVVLFRGRKPRETETPSH